MTAQEVCEKYGIAETTLSQKWSRTQENILKKHGVLIHKIGRGKSAKYEEEIVREVDTTRAEFMHEEPKKEVVIDSMFNSLCDWEFMTILAIVTTPMSVFRGSYKDFLRYVQLIDSKENVIKLKGVLSDLSDRGILLYAKDTSTDDGYFVASLYKKAENDMHVGISMIKKCKELADKNNLKKDGWSKLLKTWLGIQIMYKRQPYTMKELSSVTGMSEYSLRKYSKILEQDYIFFTSKAYKDYYTCLGKNVSLNGIYEGNRGLGQPGSKDIEAVEY